jgi:hypothetical protein
MNDPNLFTASEERTFRGYRLLVHHIPPIEEKLTVLDVAELSIYTREVFLFPSHALFNVTFHFSFEKEHPVLVEMMLRILNLQLLAGSSICSRILRYRYHRLINQKEVSSMT